MMFRQTAFAILFLHLTFSVAYSADYSIIKIVDTTTSAPSGTFSDFQTPTISGNTVAFYGAFNGSQGIFTGSGGALTNVAKVGDVFPSGTIRTFKGNGVFPIAPSISGNTVAFWCTLGSNNTIIPSICTSTGGVISSVAQTGGPAPIGTYNGVTGLTLPAINGDTLAFYSSYDDQQTTAIVASINEIPIPIVRSGDPAPTGTFHLSSFAGLNLSVSGDRVAFWSWFDGTVDEGIFTGNGGPLTTIVKTGDPAPTGGSFARFGTPVISGESVAFRASYDSGSGFFTGNGGALTKIVASGDAAPIGTFNSFTSCSYDGDTVVFTSSFNTGNDYGLFAKSGNALQTIIKKGDSLFGGTVSNIYLSPAGLDPDGSGNLAFYYKLSDGRSGIAMAVVPEPGCLLLTVAIIFCAMGRQRSDHQHKNRT